MIEFAEFRRYYGVTRDDIMQMRVDHFIADLFAMQAARRRDDIRAAMNFATGYAMTRDKEGKIARELEKQI